jgi:membrane fusion protein, multidrug efflux system
MTTMVEELELEQQTVSESRETKRDAKLTPRRRTRSKARWLIAGALVVAAAATGAYLYFSGEVSTDDAQVDAHNAPIAPKISGNISEVLVEDNQIVKAGQALVRIDPRDYQAKVDQARAALAMAQSDSLGAHANVPLTNETTLSAVSSAEGRLAAAEADYEKAQTDYDRSSTSELSYAQADVDSKRATHDRARADLARMEPLVAKDEISKQQFDLYVATARVAESDLKATEENRANADKKAAASKAAMLNASASVEAARADLEQAKANRQKVEISSAQASTAAASIKQARANLEAAELQLSYATIVAPIDGLATKKTIQVGQIVQPGQTLLTVVPLQDVWVTANFKETQLANVRAGQRAEVKVDMYGRSFEGRVDSIAGATGSTLSLLPPENATGNFVKVVQRIPVKIVLTETPAGFVFRPGMNVDATIFTK